MPAGWLADAVFRIARVPTEAVPDPAEAVARAIAAAGKEGTILATGSMFLVGRVREILDAPPPVAGASTGG